MGGSGSGHVTKVLNNFLNGFSTVANIADMYAAFDQIREMGAEPGARVVAGHDPLGTERFSGRAGSDDVIRISA
jgi:hypothetical protein